MAKVDELRAWHEYLEAEGPTVAFCSFVVLKYKLGPQRGAQLFCWFVYVRVKFWASGTMEVFLWCFWEAVVLLFFSS